MKTADYLGKGDFGLSGKIVPSWLSRKNGERSKSGSDCGANAEGGGGFQPGNTCGREDGAESGGEGADKPKGPTGSDNRFAQAREAAKADLERVRTKVLEVAADYEKKIQEAKAQVDLEWEKSNGAMKEENERFRALKEKAGKDKKEIERLYGEHVDAISKIAAPAMEAERMVKAVRLEARSALSQVLSDESKAVSDSIGLAKLHDEAAARILKQIESPTGLVNDYGFVLEDGYNRKQVIEGSDRKSRVEGVGFLQQICNPIIHEQALTTRVSYEERGTRPSAVRSTSDPAADSVVGFNSIAIGDGPDSYVHEYGHQIEYGSKETRDLTTDFLASRTQGESLVTFSEKYPEAGYNDSERGAKDGFAKAHEAAGYDKDEAERRGYYTGKKYGGSTTEVLTMGLELMHKDPVAFAKADPEWFDLVAGITTGRLLTGKQRRLKGEK
jgi:hypothetical protein